MFDDLELNPMALALGVVGGIASVIVMSKVEVNVIFKILGFVITTIVCYFMANRIANN